MVPKFLWDLIHTKCPILISCHPIFALSYHSCTQCHNLVIIFFFQFFNHATKFLASNFLHAFPLSQELYIFAKYLLHFHLENFWSSFKLDLDFISSLSRNYFPSTHFHSMWHFSEHHLITCIIIDYLLICDPPTISSLRTKTLLFSPLLAHGRNMIYITWICVNISMLYI